MNKNVSGIYFENCIFLFYSRKIHPYIIIKYTRHLNQIFAIKQNVWYGFGQMLNRMFNVTQSYSISVRFNIQLKRLVGVWIDI